jgi:hypothetical protein
MEAIKQTPPTAHNYRCTFSLPQQLAKDISFIAKRMSMSQSALLAMLLDEPIKAMAKLFAILPVDPSQPVEADVTRRLRGESVDLLRSAVADALATAEKLEPGLDL